MRLCTGRNAHTGSRLLTTALEADEGTASRPGRSLAPRKDRVPFVQEVGSGPETVWTGAENLAHTGIRSPDL